MTQQQFADALERTQPSVCEWEARGQFPGAVISKIRELGQERLKSEWKDALLFDTPKQKESA